MKKFPIVKTLLNIWNLCLNQKPKKKKKFHHFTTIRHCAPRVVQVDTTAIVNVTFSFYVRRSCPGSVLVPTELQTFVQ